MSQVCGVHKTKGAPLRIRMVRTDKGKEVAATYPPRDAADGTLKRVCLNGCSHPGGRQEVVLPGQNPALSQQSLFLYNYRHIVAVFYGPEFVFYRI